SWPPHTPQGSERRSASARQPARIGQPPHSSLARSTSWGSSANHRSAGWRRHGRSTSAPATVGPDVAAEGVVLRAVVVAAPGTAGPSSDGRWSTGAGDEVVMAVVLLGCGPATPAPPPGITRGVAAERPRALG